MQKAPTTNNCHYCKAPLLKKAWAKFCSQQCRKAFNNRRMSRGALIYDLAMTYRKDRKPGALADLCHQIGIFIQADNTDDIKSYNDYPQGIPWNIPKSAKITGQAITKVWIDEGYDAELIIRPGRLCYVNEEAPVTKEALERVMETVKEDSHENQS